MRTLAGARRDVVRTIRQVVDVVSKYAGGALPEPARSRVRGFILLLPQRWAVKAHEGGVVEGIGGASSSGVSHPHPATAGGRARTKRTHVRGAGSIDSPVNSRPTSPAPRARRERETSTTAAAGARAGRAEPVGGDAVTTTVAGAAQAAQRILTLSTESLDMMRGVTAVVRESLDRADALVFFFASLVVAMLTMTTDGWSDSV